MINLIIIDTMGGMSVKMQIRFGYQTNVKYGSSQARIHVKRYQKTIASQAKWSIDTKFSNMCQPQHQIFDIEERIPVLPSRIWVPVPSQIDTAIGLFFFKKFRELTTYSHCGDNCTLLSTYHKVELLQCSHSCHKGIWWYMGRSVDQPWSARSYTNSWGSLSIEVWSTG